MLKKAAMTTAAMSMTITFIKRNESKNNPGQSHREEKRQAPSKTDGRAVLIHLTQRFSKGPAAPKQGNPRPTKPGSAKKEKKISFPWLTS